MRAPITRATIALLFALTVALCTSAAAPARNLLSDHALETTYCRNCAPPGKEPLALIPPDEGQIEGPCGLAFGPSGSIYLADYYHRVIDLYAPIVKGQASKYQTQIALPGVNPSLAINTLDAACGLAVDSGGHLFAAEYHGPVSQLTPSAAQIDAGPATGIAIDEGDRLYVDRRGTIAVYQLPYSAEEAPLQLIGTLTDGYGVAVSPDGEYVYAADAATGTIKVYRPAENVLDPVAELSPGLATLADASLAVDPTNGHLLLAAVLQPGFEHPLAAVDEFGGPAEGFAHLGRLPGDPIAGEPSGIAVNSQGQVLLTDGNSELANAFAYGAYGEAPLPAPLAALSPATTSAALSPGSAAPTAAPASADGASPTKSRHKKHRRGSAHHRPSRRKKGGRR